MPARPWSLLLLPLLALAAWLLLRPGPGPDEAPTEVVERPPPATGAGPLLEGAAPARPAGPSRASASRPTDVDPSRAQDVRVFGSVKLADPALAAGGQVALVDPAAPTWRVLARQALPAGLAFDWSVPFGGQAATWDLRVVLCVPGRPRKTTEIALQRGEERRVDLSVGASDPSAPRIVGRLTDQRGRGLSDFPLELAHGAFRVSTGAGLPSSTDDVLVSSESGDPILVLTGPDGRFEAHAPPDASLWPLSLDPAWIVRVVEAWQLTPGKGPYRLEASPAARIRGRVCDSTTGKPLAEHARMFLVRAGGLLRSSHSWGGSSEAEFDWATAAAGEGLDDLELEVQVNAYLYAPCSIRLRPTVSGMTQELDIALRPLTPAEIGDLVVLPGVRDERGLPHAIQLMVVTEHGGSTTMVGRPPEPSGPREEGSVYRMAAGRHKLQVALAGERGRFLRWTGDVDLAGGGRTLFHVPWEPHGSLRVRLQAAEDGSWDQERLGLRLATSSSEENLFVRRADQEVRIPALPVGTWVLTQRTKEGPKEQRFEVSEGRETVVDVAP